MTIPSYTVSWIVQKRVSKGEFSVNYFEVCKLILDNVQDKNPKDDYGVTPLHFAAQNDYSKVCLLILKNVQEKNPKCQKGKTPLHFALEMDSWKYVGLFLKMFRKKTLKIIVV